MAIFRLVIFSNGGQIYVDRKTTDIPISVLNELIVKQCIESSRISNQAQIRLGKSSEFTARISRSAEVSVNVALLFPVSLRLEESEQIVEDVAKIWVSGVDQERRLALIDLRIKSCFEQKLPVTKVGFEEAATIDVEQKHDLENDPKSSNFSAVKPTRRSRKSKTKKKRRTWDGVSDSDSDAVLDYSEQTDRTNPITLTDVSNAKDLGSNSSAGFVVKELTGELTSILRSEKQENPEQFSFLKKFVGGKKLNDSDLRKVLAAMEDHLVAKNVAKDVATALCTKVMHDLVGTSTLSWTSVKETVRLSMQRELQKILTPTIATDLLASIAQNKTNKSRVGYRPYVISIVGVNGVGKSTNLGKLAFWLLQNDLKVLVAACDTFRSGAVEQLKVHVQRLRQTKGSAGEIDLFDQGYGKDAALIARHAVERASKTGYDVVLIDTAGRRHNDDRLMSSLEKFGNQAVPDKIIMVTEAVVGTDSVEQARNFDSAFGKSRGLDCFLISKCDVVGEMLGTLVNVTYATGVPVLFVGVGQQYTDLRTLSVEWAVSKLLS